MKTLWTTGASPGKKKGKDGGQTLVGHASKVEKYTMNVNI